MAIPTYTEAVTALRTASRAVQLVKTEVIFLAQVLLEVVVVLLLLVCHGKIDQINLRLSI